MKGYIYKIENRINKKKYIGQTIRSVKTRFREHINAKDELPIHRALRKYGKDKFSFTTVKEIEEESEEKLLDSLNDLETKYIKKYKSLVPNGYNILPGGNSFGKSSHVEIDRILDNEESVINIETGETYDTVYEWLVANEFSTDEQYKLYDARDDYKFRFVHEDTIIYSGEVFPPNSTLKDIRDKKAFLYVSLPHDMTRTLTQKEKEEKIKLWGKRRFCTEYALVSLKHDILESIIKVQDMILDAYKSLDEISKIEDLEKRNEIEKQELQFLENSKADLEKLKENLNFIEKCQSDIDVTTNFMSIEAIEEVFKKDFDEIEISEYE